MGVQTLGKGAKKRAHTVIRLKYSHNKASAQPLPLGILVQAGHNYIAWLVAEMII